MDFFGIDVKRSKKEKSHKKKTTADENGSEGMPTVASTSSQQQEKMLTVEARKKDGKKHSVTKLVSTDDTCEHVNSTQFDTVESKKGSRHIASLGIEVQRDQKEKRHKKKTAVDKNDNENMLANKKEKRRKEITVADKSDSENMQTDFHIKWKSGKKRKKLQDEDGKNDKAVAQQNTGVDSIQKLRKKQKKVKQASSNDNTTSINTDHAASTAQYRALEYLRMWKCAADGWTFQKVRQVWLLQNMYDPNKVTLSRHISFFT